MIIALVGPSGAGKTLLLHNLIRANIGARPLLSFTTRAKRDDTIEVDGEYQYITEDEYDRMEAADEFLKPVGVRGKRYGTRKSDIARALSEGLYFPILVPSVLKEFYAYAFTTGKQKNVYFIYLRVWEEDELRRRLGERGDKPEDIQKSISETLPFNEQAQTLEIRFEVIDATQTPEEVCQQALVLIEKYKTAATT
jgi:guanylate kinase